MPSRFIHKGLGAPDAVSRAAGIGLTKLGAVQIDRGAGDGVQYVPVPKVSLVTATTLTLTEADNGLTVISGTTNSITVNLPPTKKGLQFSMCISSLTGSGGHNFNPDDADKIQGMGFSKSDGDAVTCVAASDAVGDFITLIADGSDGWFVGASKGSWT